LHIYKIHLAIFSFYSFKTYLFSFLSSPSPSTLFLQNQVNGPASLNWVKKSSDDVIILTPGYEQGGLLAGAAFTLIALCGALIAGVGS
jgi:hypothetical protein